jgi:hypothetical protein
MRKRTSRAVISGTGDTPAAAAEAMLRRWCTPDDPTAPGRPPTGKTLQLYAIALGLLFDWRGERRPIRIGRRSKLTEQLATRAKIKTSYAQTILRRLLVMLPPLDPEAPYTGSEKQGDLDAHEQETGRKGSV